MNLQIHVKHVKKILKSKKHFLEKSAEASHFQDSWSMSERDAAKKLGISKSSMHRFNVVANASQDIRYAAYEYDTDFYAVYFMMSAPDDVRIELRSLILAGKIRRSKQAKNFIDAQKDPEKRALQRELTRIANRVA